MPEPIEWLAGPEQPELSRPAGGRGRGTGHLDVEVASSPVAMVSRPDEVVDLIETALKGIKA